MPEQNQNSYLEGLLERIESRNNADVGSCDICGRELTYGRSLEHGRGPVCRRKVPVTPPPAPLDNDPEQV